MKLTRIAAASVLYFAVVFGAGMLLGPIRVFWLEPRLGKSIAVLCEMPFLLTAMVLAARWLPGIVRLSGARGQLVAMGLGALILQQLADVVVGIMLRGLTLSEQLQNFETPAGVIYAVALLLFVAVPVLVNGRRRQP
jgi:hypothetical protein